MRMLWLRKCNHTSNLYQHAAGQPSHRRAAARPPAQQNAGRQPEPAPAQAQAVPKPKTAAQLARRHRSLIRLQHKHLARALARERTARGLRVWCARARVALASQQQQQLAPARASRLVARDELDPPFQRWEDIPPCRPPPLSRLEEVRADEAEYAARRPPRALALAAPSPPAPALAAPPPPALALAAPPPPALALAAPPPPSQQPPSALAAAARAALDACEMQDDRGSKRDALARTPPRPTAAPPTSPPPAGKRVRAGGLGAVLAAAAPAAAAPQPLTATSYHPAALAAADPNRRFA